MDNLKHTTSFVVFPEHTNHMEPIIFGGKFMAEMDLCAAQCVRRFLYGSFTADSSVTHKASFEFKKPAYTGDFIVLNAEVQSVGKKSIVVNVSAMREKKKRGADSTSIAEEIAVGTFVFIAVNLEDADLSKRPEFLPYVNHGI